MMDDFERTEQEAARKALQLKLDERREKVQELLKELADEPTLESEQLIRLTPSDDLETVKRTVNQIIDVLSKS
jgi:heterodisulfide reductase subunit B